MDRAQTTTSHDADQTDRGPGHRALHAGDHRDRAGEHQPDHRVPVVGQLPDEGARVVGGGEALHVAADAEPRPRWPATAPLGSARADRGRPPAAPAAMAGSSALPASGRSSVTRQTSPSISVSTRGRASASVIVVPSSGGAWAHRKGADRSEPGGEPHPQQPLGVQQRLPGEDRVEEHERRRDERDVQAHQAEAQLAAERGRPMGGR